MFDKYELGTIERALKRSIDAMRESKFVGKDDPHLLECESLRAKAEELKKEST